MFRISGAIVLQCGRMADLSLDPKQRKLEQMEAELLASDQEMEICDEDLKEAEKQLNKNQCVRCYTDFVPEFGMICKVDSTHAFCITCVYWKLIWQASCPSGMHCTLESESAAWRFTTEEKIRACNVTFMMELLPKAAWGHLKGGNEPALNKALGMTLGEYLKDKEAKRLPACPACKLQIEDSGMMSDHIEKRCKPRCLLKKDEFYEQLPVFENDFPAPPPQNWWKLQSELLKRPKMTHWFKARDGSRQRQRNERGAFYRGKCLDYKEIRNKWEDISPRYCRICTEAEANAGRAVYEHRHKSTLYL